MRQKKTSVNLVVLFTLVSLMMPTSLFDISFISEPTQYLDGAEISVRAAADPSAFISVWDTTLTSTGSSASNQVRLPLEDSGNYDFEVDWGDNTSDTITSWDQAEVTHTYNSTGIFTINITGTIQGWRFYNERDNLKILKIQQWGSLRLGNADGYFYGCENLQLTTIDVLDLTGTTTLFRAFEKCGNLGSSGNLNGWDVSSVKDMTGMFYEASLFDQPLGNWDVSSVNGMNGMFYEALSFNQPLDAWDVSSVSDMGGMFIFSSFNQSLDSWDVSSVRYMCGMFTCAFSFNQPLEAWDVSSVVDMSALFMAASSFNQPLDAWDVSSVKNMRDMFRDASSFDQPLGNWDVSSVTSMKFMFSKASSFNQPLGTWNVSSVSDMQFMFSGVTLSTNNYDGMLVSWSQLSLQSSVVFNAGNSQYSAGTAGTARQLIIDTFGWTITDGGQVIAPNASILNAIESPSSSGNISLTWNSVEGAETYSIYRSMSPITDVSGLTAIITGLTAMTYQDTSLSNGTYYYVVVATNDGGDSPLSNCESVIVALISETTTETTTTSFTSTTDTDTNGIAGFPFSWFSIIMLVSLIGVTGCLRPRRM